MKLNLVSKASVVHVGAHGDALFGGANCTTTGVCTSDDDCAASDMCDALLGVPPPLATAAGVAAPMGPPITTIGEQRRAYTKEDLDRVTQALANSSGPSPRSWCRRPRPTPPATTTSAFA